MTDVSWDASHPWSVLTSVAAGWAELLADHLELTAPPTWRGTTQAVDARRLADELAGRVD